MTQNDLRLDELGPGQAWIRLVMKAEDTEHNRSVHDTFRRYAADRCKNDYTLALDTLLSLAEMDAKSEIFAQHLLLLEEKINALERKSERPLKKEEKEDDGFF